MIFDKKRTDKIFTYDVIFRPWRHRNDSFWPEMNSGELCGHFDIHKGTMNSFYPDFIFCHVLKIAKKGWCDGLRKKPPTPMFFYALEDPRNTLVILSWSILKKLLSSVMLSKFYPGIARYNLYQFIWLILHSMKRTLKHEEICTFFVDVIDDVTFGGLQ